MNKKDSLKVINPEEPTSNETVTTQTIFKQFSIEEDVPIHVQKPEAEEIFDSKTNLIITSTRLVQTPKGTSSEGQILTGWKMVVEGILVQTVVYIANDPAQSLHAARLDSPFSTYLILPEGYKLCQPIQVEGYIENACVKLTDSRCIFKNITLRIEGNYKC